MAAVHEKGSSHSLHERAKSLYEPVINKSMKHSSQPSLQSSDEFESQLPSITKSVALKSNWSSNSNNSNNSNGEREPL